MIGIRRNRKSGQSLSELVGALAVMTPLLLISIDLLSVCVGLAINDATCRDAARAAAAGPPGDQSIGTRNVNPAKTPYVRARQVIKNVYQSNLPMKIRDNLQVVETVRDYPPADRGGGSLDGEVSVETTIDIYPPFLVNAIVGESGVSLKTKHVVPFTYTIAATTSP